MQLEQAGEAAPADRLRAPIADRVERLDEADAVAIPLGIGLVARERAGEDAGGEHRGGETAALLVGPVDELERRVGAVVEIVQRAQHLQPGEHAERAVELAAGRLGVEMRAHRDRRRGGVLALAAREHGADLVHRDGAAERLALLAEPVAHALVLIGQGQPANAAFRRAADLGRVHQRVPEPLRIDLQIGDHGVTSARATPRGALTARQVVLATWVAGNGGRAT